MNEQTLRYMGMVGRLRLNVNGTIVSITFGETSYCEPREGGAFGKTEYTQVEVGLWTEPTEELAKYADGPVNPVGELTVYAYVPMNTLINYLATL